MIFVYSRGPTPLSFSPSIKINRVSLHLIWSLVIRDIGFQDGVAQFLKNNNLPNVPHECSPGKLFPLLSTSLPSNDVFIKYPAFLNVSIMNSQTDRCRERRAWVIQYVLLIKNNLPSPDPPLRKMLPLAYKHISYIPAHTAAMFSLVIYLLLPWFPAIHTASSLWWRSFSIILRILLFFYVEFKSSSEICFIFVTSFQLWKKPKLVSPCKWKRKNNNTEFSYAGWSYRREDNSKGKNLQKINIMSSFPTPEILPQFSTWRVI